MDAYEVLVIVLSITFAVFLILAIIVAIYTIKLLKSLRRSAEKAEVVINDIVDTSWSIRHSLEPLKLIKMFIKLFTSIKDSTKQRRYR